MTHYRISFYTDMGHLLTRPDYAEIPRHIYDFVSEKRKNKLIYATDNEKKWCRFYILKPGLLNEWTYNLNEDTITIDYSKLDKFDPESMIYL